ncbi:SGNH/GDSL hydrolase family protein [Xanthobacter sp. AM11]|uniref:SGNH/GDSL hydrolase family protein n=1 Tax=Xanthobacter sp. AM11 TaxID=3380643 RepID=UPI0039BEEA4A
MSNRTLRAASGILSPLAKPIYRYIHIGDSLTQGSGDAQVNAFGSPDMTWQTALASNGALLPVRNAGVGGQTSPMISARVPRDVLKYAPDVVGVTMGTNDVIALNSSAYITASLQAVHDALKSAGVFFFVTTIPPYAARAALVNTINQLITGFCATNAVPLVDWYAIANDPANPGNWRAGYTNGDGIHANARTSKLFADANWAVIGPMLTSTRKHQRPRVHDAANLLFPTTGIANTGAPASTTVRDGLFANYRTLAMNGYSLPTPRVFDTVATGTGTAPTVTATVAPVAGVNGNVWSITATPNGAGSVNFQISDAATPIIDLTRYQGRRLRFSFMFGASGLDVENTAEWLEANGGKPLSYCGLALAPRLKGGTAAPNLAILDLVDGSASLGQASYVSLDWGANPFSGPLYSDLSRASHYYDLPLTPCNHEFNVPPGAVSLNIQVGLRFRTVDTTTATQPITLQLAEFMLVDVGPAQYPALTVSNDPLRFLKVTAAKTLTQGEILAIDYYPCDAAAGAFTLTLPAAQLVSGIPIIVKKTDASANALTLAANGAETIDGAGTYVLATQYEYVRLVSNGTGWDVIAAG